MGAKLAALPVAYMVLAAYWTVLVAELAGDKSIYTVTSLALRFPIKMVFGMMTVAFGGKMLAGVLLGKFIAGIPLQWTAILSAGAFFASGLFIWVREPRPVAKERIVGRYTIRAAGICFVSLFFTEWGDPGQITVAALALQAHSAWAPWLGGTMALVTKGGLAMGIGLKLRDHLPQRMLRMLASASCCLLGILALSGIAFP